MGRRQGGFLHAMPGPSGRMPGGGGGSGGLTPISFTDPLDDSSKSANWAGSTVAPAWDQFAALGGSNVETTYLRLSGFTASTYQFNGYSSAAAINMAAGQSIWAKFTLTGSIYASIGLWDDSGYASQLVRAVLDGVNGFASAGNNNAGAGTTFWGAGSSVAYDTTNHKYLRLHNTGTQFEVYTAPASGSTYGTWTLRGATTAGYFTPSSVRVFIGGVVNSGAPGSVDIEDFCT
jgi:hypothetical protein